MNAAVNPPPLSRTAAFAKVYAIGFRVFLDTAHRSTPLSAKIEDYSVGEWENNQ